MNGITSISNSGVELNKTLVHNLDRMLTKKIMPQATAYGIFIRK